MQEQKSSTSPVLTVEELIQYIDRVKKQVEEFSPSAAMLVKEQRNFLIRQFSFLGNKNNMAAEALKQDCSEIIKNLKQLNQMLEALPEQSAPLKEDELQLILESLKYPPANTKTSADDYLALFDLVSQVRKVCRETLVRLEVAKEIDDIITKKVPALLYQNSPS